MCGIVGFVDTVNKYSEEELNFNLSQMSNKLVHRGPDDSGTWCDTSVGVALGHRRLSIVDLSSEGHQPMISKSSRYIIVFNGEVYNFKELRSELESIGLSFRGHSDTEVVLTSIEVWGFNNALLRFVGMFAIAVWDRTEKKLYLARDRMGEKPLYYGWMNGAFLFGSELKALREHPSFNGEIDRDALALFLKYNCIPSPSSIYKGIKKLQPGSYVVIDIMEGHEDTKNIQYWSLATVAQNGIDSPSQCNETELILQLENILINIVSKQMISDVPLGAFLSGGVDSTTVVSIMQSLSNVPVKTFSIGFTETEYNEANYAKEIANYLGTDHTELYVTPEMAMAVIPKLAEIYDEPFSDSSQIPTYLVSRLARTQVSVSLSGDGGDELFGGYNRYSWGKSIWTRIHKIPKPIRKIVSKGMHTITPFYYDKLFSVISPILPTKYKQQLPGLKIQKLANILDSSTSKDLYSRLITHWKNPAKVVKGTTNTNDLYSRQFEVLDTDNFTHQMMYMDMQTFLTDDILTKVDRSSMSVGLEARVPFLDHRLIEFAWKVPLDMKIKNNQGKWLLRQVLYKYVPMEMIERPKMGFGIPIDSWLRGPLRAWADELLNKERIEAEGIFEYELIHKKWREHLNGKRNWAYHIWDILMFQCWYDKHKK